jgi:hypothetical protein
MPGPAYSASVIVPNYETLGEVGSGGLGVVYKARHLQLKRIVALKMIRAGIHALAEDRIRFRTEAEAVARLQHPNVVQIYEIGEYGGLPFLAFEFCDGGSLDKKLNGRALPAREAAQLVEKLARAMQAAHQAQVIHRDLKPANVLLSGDGQPKVSDFGMAKLQDEQGLTQTGAVFGTPSYMAPEQASGQVKAIGPATDIYSLGAILYECLTGRPPFLGRTILETLEQVKTRPPIPPRELNPSIPADLASICLKCLSRFPGDRYSSAEELAEDLECYLSGKPVRSRRWRAARDSWRRLNRYLGGIVAMTCLTAFLTIILGALLGLFSYTSFPIDHARADLWITAPGCRHVEEGEPVAESWVSRLRATPGIVQTEPYILQFAYWRQAAHRELCCVIGCDLSEDSIGTPEQLSSELRARLRQLGTVVIDSSEKERLQVHRPGDAAFIGRSKVSVVGFLNNARSLSGPYVFCSLQTAREVLKMEASETTFVLAKCDSVELSEETARDLRSKLVDVSVYSAGDFSLRTRLNYLTKTKAGLVCFGFCVILCPIAALAICGTLHRANQDWLRERYDTGKPRRIRTRLAARCVVRSVFVSVTGSILAFPIVLGLTLWLRNLTVIVLLPYWLIPSVIVLSILVALVAALLASIRALGLTVSRN